MVVWVVLGFAGFLRGFGTYRVSGYTWGKTAFSEGETLMTYRGHVKDGQILLDDPVSLPEGVEVQIAVCDAPT